MLLTIKVIPILFLNSAIKWNFEKDKSKQPSFTVKNARGRLIKIDHLILIYLSFTDTIMQLEFLTFVSQFNHNFIENGQVFNFIQSTEYMT